MAVIKSATYLTRCPFSKTLIKPGNMICWFNQDQLAAFKKIINKLLKIFLPTDIINLIIKKTEYEKLVYSFGHSIFTHWTIKSTTRRDTINLPSSISTNKKYHQHNCYTNGWLVHDSEDFERTLELGREKENDLPGIIVSDESESE